MPEPQPPQRQFQVVPDVRYRSPRGGHVPLNARQQRQMLELYSDHARPVREIAELFGLSVNQVYRILPLLGVRAQ